MNLTFNEDRRRFEFRCGEKESDNGQTLSLTQFLVFDSEWLCLGCGY